ncbi:MAG: GNAT family N-acetyltransferase [Candidatus Limnocylindria bacterium]
MPFTLTRYRTVDEFLAAAGGYLAEREAEHNLIFGICSAIRANPETPGEAPSFAAVTDDAGRVSAAALRTPPWNVVLSEVDTPEATDLLADDWAAHDPDLRGVTGPKAAAGRFSKQWTRRTGRTARIELEERIFRLARVIPPRPTPGSWRLAADRDRQILADWFVAFVEEAAPESPRPDDLDAAVDRWIRRIGRTMYLWEDGDRVVSLVGAGGETPNGIRIGPVYTPPELRRRGYASALTAAASQDQLDAGRRFCFLFTDLANPTSNKIYQAIGYEPVGDVDQYLFETA